MKTIQEIAEETRELLNDLRDGRLQISKKECSNTLWKLRGYLADNDERERLDDILANIAGGFGSIDDVEECFEPKKENNTNELWKWLVRDQSHLRFVEEAINQSRLASPAKDQDLYDLISQVLLHKEYQIFWAAKAYVMEVFKNQDNEEDEYDDEE